MRLIQWKWLPLVLGFITFAGIVSAQQIIEASQGAPGTYGPWVTAPGVCVAPIHATTSVGVAAANVPATNLAVRRFITMCNSVENTAAPTVKIRIDGVTPITGLGNAGDVLRVGDCITYNVGAGVVIQAIASAAATQVTTLECR